MSDPIFLTLSEVIERYRGQVSEGTLVRSRSAALVILPRVISATLK